MNLYEVQDNDRPMYVVAESWQRALECWREQIQIENELTPGCDVPEPSGIRLVAENRGDMPDLLVSGESAEVGGSEIAKMATKKVWSVTASDGGPLEPMEIR